LGVLAKIFAKGVSHKNPPKRFPRGYITLWDTKRRVLKPLWV